jgi:hypothetical protein
LGGTSAVGSALRIAANSCAESTGTTVITALRG